MTPLSHLKLGLAVAGLLIWGYGVRVDESSLRWVGIGFLAVAAALRFWGRWRRGERPNGDGSGTTPNEPND